MFQILRWSAIRLLCFKIAISSFASFHSHLASAEVAFPGFNFMTSSGGISNSDIKAGCYMANFMKIGFAVANGKSCDALRNADGGPASARSVCGSVAPSNGPSKEGKYSMADHQPLGGNGKPVKFTNDSTDCSGQVCGAWLAAGFKPAVEKNFGSSCPTAAELAKLDHECLEDVPEGAGYLVGDVVCCPRSGGAQNGATGHCINVADQVGTPGPTSALTSLVIANASGGAAGWKLQGGQLAFGSSVMQGKGCKILRPKSDSGCFESNPPGFEGEDSVKSCSQIAQTGGRP